MRPQGLQQEESRSPQTPKPTVFLSAYTSQGPPASSALTPHHSKLKWVRDPVPYAEVPHSPFTSKTCAFLPGRVDWGGGEGWAGRGCLSMGWSRI